MPVPTKAIPHSKPSLQIIRKPKIKNHRVSKDYYSEEYIISVHNIFRVQLPKSLNFISFCTSVAPKEKLQNSSLSSSHLIFFSRHPNKTKQHKRIDSALKPQVSQNPENLNQSEKCRDKRART